MSKGPAVPIAAASVVLAVWRELNSVEWARALGDSYERAWLITDAVCDALHDAGIARIPSARAIKVALLSAERDNQIVEGFTGHNYAQLAQQHRLSVRTVRRIIERERRERKKDV